MKMHWIVLTALCALFLAGMAMSAPQPGAEPAPAFDVAPVAYSSRQFRSEDGKRLVAEYHYQTAVLTVENADSLTSAAREAAEQTAETFYNALCKAVYELWEQGESMGVEAVEIDRDTGGLSQPYYDTVTVDASVSGEIVSVCLYRESYTGGAHPNRYTSGYLFDLSAGQFIDPAQLAEDPEAFRTGAAALLLEKAESHSGRKNFWQDYADVIAHWNEGTVLFDEDGMRVLYSPYELGPYSIGEVEFRLGWDELDGLIGNSGMERLGAAAEQTEG